jgi:hypothetical protein
MEPLHDKTFLNTVVGSIFTIAMIQPAELLNAFVLGGAGAAGAFFISSFLKWIWKRFFKKDINFDKE